MPQFEEKAATGRFFFRKENRILKRSDYQRVYNLGRPWRRSLVHVFILPPVEAAASEVDSETPTDPTRLGITATKKVGNAVKRNRARRLVRESFRHSLPELKPGFSIIVNVMRAAVDAPYDKLDKQLRDVYQQAGVMKEVNDGSVQTSSTSVDQ